MKKDAPNWAPPSFSYNRSDPCIERLAMSPEMEFVWKTLYKWFDEWEQEHKKKELLKFRPEKESELASYVQAGFDQRHGGKVKGIALKCNADLLGVITMTEPARQKLSDSISVHAKQLKNDLHKWRVVKTLNAHFDPSIQHKYLLGFLERFTDEFRYDEPFEAIVNLDENSGIDHEGLGGRINSFIWGEIKFQINRGAKGDLRQGDATIYDVLEHLADSSTEHLPKPIAKRGLDQNKRRLLGIRSLAEFIYNHLGKSPSPVAAREVIATFVRVALDDPEVGEDTVKDALRNYDFMRD